MALIPIMGQPVNLVPNNERAFGCEPENPYCVLYGQQADGTEKILLQMKQEPCADSLVSNGTFTADADWTHDANVVIADGKATHVVGTIGEIYQTIYTPYALGNYFSLFLTVTGLGAGQIDVYIGSSVLIFSITSNGIYQKYWFPPFDNNDLRFEFSADCDGSISNISAFKLLDEDEITAFLSTSDDVFVDDLNIDMLDEYICFSLPTLPLSEGCYKIQVIDPCTVIADLTDVFVDPDFDDAGEWGFSSNSPYTPYFFAIYPGQNLFYFDSDGTGTPPVTGQAVQPFNLPIGQRLYIEFELDGMSAGNGVADIEFILFAQDGGDVQEIVVAEGGVFSTSKTVSAIIPSNFLSPSNLDIGVMMRDVATGNVNYVGYAQARYAIVNESDGIFTSNCLKVLADVNDTRIVEGFADEVNPYPASNKSLGFMFHRDFFWLRARLGVQFSNPHTPTSTDNNLSSNGRTKKAYAQLSKAWDLTFHAVDENMHDTITNIINCDSFQIEGNEYITDEKEYTANYGENGINPTAESTIEVQKVLGTRFNTNQ